MNLKDYWKATLTQDAAGMRRYFADGAYVNWHNTNEHFTAEEFIRINCAYPGQWDGEMERVVEADGLFVTVVHVYSTVESLSFHVTSFIRVENGLIASIDEYWGDDGDAPEWRRNMHGAVTLRHEE